MSLYFKYYLPPQNLIKARISFDFPVQDLMMPSFAGRSYLELVRIHHVNKELTMEVEFRTLNNDGILVYAGQNENGQGDYVSLSVKDGHVEFR